MSKSNQTVCLKPVMKAINERIKKLNRIANEFAQHGASDGGHFWKEAAEMRREVEVLTDRLAALKSLEFSLGILIRDSKRQCFKVVGGRANRTGSVSGKRRTKVLSSASRSMLKGGEFLFEFDNMVSLAKALKIALPKGIDMKDWRVV